MATIDPQRLNNHMPSVNDTTLLSTQSVPFLTALGQPHISRDCWLTVQFEFDGHDIDLFHEIIDSLDGHHIIVGCTMRAVIRSTDISDLMLLRLADPGQWHLRWDVEKLAASSCPCFDPSGLTVFVEYFAPNAIVDLVGDAQI
jgi:hypothetical protein